MRLTPVNSAEAVFEAFFDPQLSELKSWSVDADGTAAFRLWQNWVWIQWEWQLPRADGRLVRFTRHYDLDCSAYDRLLVCATLPEGGWLEIAADTDAGPRTRRGAPYGPAKREEWLPLDGARRIRSLTIQAYSPTRAAGHGWIYWLGLQSTTRLPAHLAQWSGFDARWENYLQPPEFEPTFAPTYGLLIDQAELEDVRTRFADSPAAAALREAAVDARKFPPEQLIGEFACFWNSNQIRRERDHDKVLTIHGPLLAQAGVLFKDKALCRLAARFALAIAHCGKWDDTFMCNLPGSTWEQRSFVHSICVYETAVILDLCGEWFTPLGREVILRRIAEEGLGEMNFNVWWWEYIFHNNQLAWFAPGRLLGYLLLEKTMPARHEGFARPEKSRVAPYTELALQDLLENLDRVLLPDGGYVEGPTYFTWIARQAFLALHLYARARGRPMRELMPAAMSQTVRTAEVLASTDDRIDLLPVCDATYAFPEALAHLAAYLPDSAWVSVYHKQVARVGAAPSLLAMSLAARIPAHGPALPAFAELPATGLMSSVRRLGDAVVKLVVVGNKAGADHTHEDKGSFILEFAGDSFAMDFGAVDYSNPVVEELKTAPRHNMLTPWSLTVRPKPAKPIMVDIRPVGRGDEKSFHAEIDVTAGWEGWFKRWHRTWDSPTPDTLVITDDWEIAQGEGVIFHWTTPLPMRREGDKIIVTGRRGHAEITLPPDTDAALEALPLMNPARRTTDALRREIVRYGLDHAETQPRLTIRQRGTHGRLAVAVRLFLDAA